MTPYYQQAIRRILLGVLVLSATTSLHAQSFQDRLLYMRMEGNHASIRVNDGLGADSHLIDTACVPQLVMDGRYLFYIKGTLWNNWFGNLVNGGQWIRRTVNGGNEFTLYNSSDFLVGYDMFLSDSSSAVAYACNIYNNSFDNATVLGTMSGICDDDGPRIRQSDELVVGHNVFASLFTVQRNGTGRTPIPNTSSFDTWPTWSPDGEWILFGRSNGLYAAGVEYGINVVNYYKIKQNGDSLTKLTWNAPGDSATFTSNAVWSADGRSIFAAGTLNGQYGLLEIAADGSMLAESLPTATGGLIHYITGTMPTRLAIGIPDPVQTSSPIQLQPNPTRDHVRISWMGDPQAVAGVQLLNEVGALLGDIPWLPANPIDLDLLGRSPGIYLIKVTTDQGSVITLRIVKVD